MPHTKSAWKRLRSSETRRVRNRVTAKAIKLQTRKFTDALKAAEPALAATESLVTIKKLDKAAARGVIHPNKAARLKSKMALKLNILKANPEAGAYLDTFDAEPYKGPLTELENVLLSAHIGSYAKEARIRMEMDAVDNLLRGLGGGKGNVA